MIKFIVYNFWPVFVCKNYTFFLQWVRDYWCSTGTSTVPVVNSANSWFSLKNPKNSLKSFLIENKLKFLELLYPLLELKYLFLPLWRDGRDENKIENNWIYTAYMNKYLMFLWWLRHCIRVSVKHNSQFTHTHTHTQTQIDNSLNLQPHSHVDKPLYTHMQ